MTIGEQAPAVTISDEQAQFFLDNGYLIIRDALRETELLSLRRAMDELMDYGTAEERSDPDFMYGPGHRTGKPVLKRIEYVIDKSDECKVLLGNPFILRSVEKLMGKDLIPTWDSMVLKLPGEGIIVPWHRDAGTGCVGDTPIFNVDFYLDEADEDTCVWAYPGSHLWPEEQILEITTQEDFSTKGAVPLLMKPGDVLFHNILLLHGSPSNSSDKLRRVIYYEFRTAQVENELGPHRPEYIPLKQQVLLACLEHRKNSTYAAEEEPYHYSPPPPFIPPAESGEGLSTYRFPHHEYWRN